MDGPIAISIYIAIGSMVLGILLVGLPGAIWIELFSLLRLVKPIEGENAWPAAILVSLLWPLLIPLLTLLRVYWYAQESIYLIYALGGFVGVLVIVWLVHLFFGPSKS